MFVERLNDLLLRPVVRQVTNLFPANRCNAKFQPLIPFLCCLTSAISQYRRCGALVDALTALLIIGSFSVIRPSESAPCLLSFRIDSDNWSICSSVWRSLVGSKVILRGEQTLFDVRPQLIFQLQELVVVKVG